MSISEDDQTKIFLIKGTRETRVARDYPSFTQVLSKVLDENNGNVPILNIER